jgi:hypothetical protein
MQDDPAATTSDVKAKIVKEIIPGASPELVREIVEDLTQHQVPSPASEEVELERIHRAQVEEEAEGI